MLKLIGSDGSRFYSWPLRPGEYIVGRAKDSDFYLPDSTVSRQHARIECPENGQNCFIVDQQSHNGTVVNGNRISDRVQLKEGDHIIFGQVEFRVASFDDTNASTGRGESTRLAATDPEKSVFLSLKEALKPLPSKVTDLPEVLPTLFEMAKILVLPEPQEAMLQKALGLVNRVIPAERLAVLDTSDETDEIITNVCLLPGGKDPGEFNLSRTVVNEIFQQKNSILIDPHDDPRFSSQDSIILSDIRSAMAVPLFDGGAVRGILYADTSNPMHRYNDDHLRLLATFGNLIASRLLNYELIRERHEKEIMGAELRRASMIQRNLLAKTIPEVKGYSIHALQEQCRMVGGDLYDVARLRDSRLAFVVADVSGKGMGGALLMSNILASFRILYEDDDFDLGRVIKQVSRQLFCYSAAEDFATVFAGVLDPENNTLSFVNAGHNPPLLVRSDGTVKYLEPSGTMIGAFDFSDWQQETVEIGVGDLVLVFTDGVVEADCRDEHYGLERLERLACGNRDKSPRELSNRIMEDVESFAAGTPQSDDITLLTIKRE